jgi:hypothetical protein
MKGVDAKEVIVFASAICSGFVAVLEEKLAIYRGEKVDDREASSD